MFQGIEMVVHKGVPCSDEFIIHWVFLRLAQSNVIRRYHVPQPEGVAARSGKWDTGGDVFFNAQSASLVNAFVRGLPVTDWP